MSPEQRKYLFVESAIGSAVVNAVINGLIGFAATKGLARFPVFGVPGVVPDLIATAFGVAFGVSLGTILQARIDLAKGKITPPAELSPRLSAFIARLPQKGFARAMAAGVVAVPVFAPPVIAAVALAGVPALDRSVFVSVKAAFAAVEAACITPYLVLASLLAAGNARPPS